MNILWWTLLTASVTFMIAAAGVADALFIRVFGFAQSLSASGNHSALIVRLATHPARLSSDESVCGIILFTFVATGLVLGAFRGFAGLSRLLLRTAR